LAGKFTLRWQLPMPERWTSLERVAAALEHRELDRVPFDLGGSVVTGMHRTAYQNLRRYLGLREVPIEIVDQARQLARIDQDVIDRLRVDVRAVDPLPPSVAPLATPVVEAGGAQSYLDEWGIAWSTPVGDHVYFDMVGHPLADAQSVADLEHFAWPDPLDPARFETLKVRADRIVIEQKRAYVLGPQAPGIFDIALGMRGVKHFLLDMTSQQKFASALLDIITELKMHYWERALEVVGANVLIVSESDNIAAARGPMISLEMYRQLIAPRHRRLFEFVKRRAQSRVYIFYHSCGAVQEFIPSLIEEGVDILNPVRVSAKGMDTGELKKRFGRDLTFWGGGVDGEHILPHGTPAEVAAEVRRRIEDLAPGGGFVFSTVHNVQADVPPENYMAMWEALQEYGGY
jgi:uroporphyrinogen decarboxylase